MLKSTRLSTAEDAASVKHVPWYELGFALSTSCCHMLGQAMPEFCYTIV